MYFGEIEPEWMNDRAGPEDESLPTDTAELAVNDRCLNLLPFRRLAANDSEQPEAAILKYLLRHACRPTSSVTQFTPSIASQLTVVTSRQTKTLAELNSRVA